MNKVEHDGMIAVLVSSGYGAGWSTMNSKEHQETLCMDAEIVQAVLDHDIEKAVNIAKNKCDGIFTGGALNLRVKWIKQGTEFIVVDYAGDESLKVLASQYIMTA